MSCNRPGRLHSLPNQATGNQYSVLQQARKVTLHTQSSNRKPVQCPATGQEGYTPYPIKQQETNTVSCNRRERLHPYPIKQRETNTVSCNRPERLHSLPNQATRNQYKVLQQARNVTPSTQSSSRKPVQCPATGQKGYTVYLMK